MRLGYGDEFALLIDAELGIALRAEVRMGGELRATYEVWDVSVRAAEPPERGNRRSPRPHVHSALPIVERRAHAGFASTC